MISAVSTQIVEDLGKDSLSPVNGIEEALCIEPWTVLVEKTSRNWMYVSSKQYKALQYKIADVVTENADALKKINIQSRPFAKSYNKSRELKLFSTMAIDIFNRFPYLKAEAYAAGGISMNIKTGGLTVKKIDEAEFEKAMRKRALDRDHTFFKYLQSEKGMRLCVIKSVLKTDEETVIEYTCKKGSSGDISSKEVGSVSADISNSKVGTITLEAGTVFACRWQRMTFDESTSSISPEIQDSAFPQLCNPIQVIAGAGYEPLPEYDGYEFEDLDEIMSSIKENRSVEENKASTEEGNRSFEEKNVNSEDNNSSFDGISALAIHDIIVYSSDEESIASNEEENNFVEVVEVDEVDEVDEDVDERDQDSTLYDLYDASEEQIGKFKAAVGIVVRSASDVKALLEVFEDEDDEDAEDAEVETFRSKLKNSDAVWILLGLMGYKIKNNHLKQTTRGPFITLIPRVLEASTLFDGKDIEFISKCDDYQKTEILRIIKAAGDHKESVTIDSKFLQELQNEPVENIFAFLDVDIDFQNGKVLLPSTDTQAHQPLKYLLHSL